MISKMLDPEKHNKVIIHTYPNGSMRVYINGVQVSNVGTISLDATKHGMCVDMWEKK